MASFIHYLERLYDFGKEAGGFVAGNEKLFATIVWPHFLGHPDHPAGHDLQLLCDPESAAPEDRMIRLFFRQPPGDLLRMTWRAPA